MKLILIIIFIMQISLLPKQIELKGLIEDSPYEWIGYGGARGGSKSHGIRDIGIHEGYNYNAKSLIFRRYSQELLDTHIYPLFARYPELRKYFNKTEKMLYDGSGIPILQFGYADSEDDIYKFQGTEYDYIFVDEATQCTQEQIEFLRTSNRTVNPKIKKAKMILTMNPGGVGHAFVKRIFVDKLYQENENPDLYTFLQAKVWDNYYWVRPYCEEQGITIKDYYYKLTEEQRKQMCLLHSDYAKNLAALPEDRKLAYLFGDWDIFGGMFFKYFSKKTEVIKPFEIPKDWTIIGSLDPGWTSPCAFGLLAQDLSGNIYLIATYYESDRSAEQHAQAIKDFHLNKGSLTGAFTGYRTPSLYVSGRDAFARKDRHAILATEKTFADVFLDHGMYLTPAVTDRIPGWWAWKGLIPNKFFVFDYFNKDCLREMSTVLADDKNPEDIQGRGNNPEVKDHALDMIRYGIMSLFKPEVRKEVPEPEGRNIILPQEGWETKF